MTNSSSAAGFTLVEILIAVLVLAIGMLGMAALQVKGLQFNHTAYLRSQATALSLDMADRMRANRTAVDNNNDPAIDNSYASVTGTLVDPGYNCQSSFPSGQTSCAAAQFAAMDIYQWRTLVQQTLPLGNGTVSCADNVTTDGDACSTHSIHTITITWDDNRDNSNTNDPSFSYGFQP